MTDLLQQILNAWRQRHGLACGHRAKLHGQVAGASNDTNLRCNPIPLGIKPLDIAEIDAEPHLARNDVAGPRAAALVGVLQRHPLFSQHTPDLKRAHHPYNAIEPPGRGHGIDMGTRHHRRP